MFDGGKFHKWTQGEWDFSIRQFPPFKAMGVLGELQKIILPAIGGAINSIQKQDDNKEVDLAVVGSAIGEALMTCTTSIDGERLEKAVKLLLDAEYIAVSPKGKKDYQRLEENIVDEVYIGRPFDMIVLCAKVFEINYLDFSKLSSVPTGLRGIYADMKRTFKEQSGSDLEM